MTHIFHIPEGWRAPRGHFPHHMRAHWPAAQMADALQGKTGAERTVVFGDSRHEKVMVAPTGFAPDKLQHWLDGYLSHVESDEPINVILDLEKGPGLLLAAIGEGRATAPMLTADDITHIRRVYAKEIRADSDMDRWQAIRGTLLTYWHGALSTAFYVAFYDRLGFLHNWDDFARNPEGLTTGYGPWPWRGIETPTGGMTHAVYAAYPMREHVPSQPDSVKPWHEALEHHLTHIEASVDDRPRALWLSGSGHRPQAWGDHNPEQACAYWWRFWIGLMQPEHIMAWRFDADDMAMLRAIVGGDV